MKKYKIKVEAEIELSAVDKEHAREKFFEQTESYPQQTFATWIDDHMTVKEIKGVCRKHKKKEK